MKTTTGFVARLLVSGIMLASAAAKWMDFTDTALYFSGLLNVSLPAMGISLSIVIAIELLFSAMILFGLQHAVVFRSAVVLLIGFTVFSVLLLFAGVSNCGCMGTKISSAPIVSVVKNLILLFALVMTRTTGPAAATSNRAPRS